MAYQVLPYLYFTIVIFALILMVEIAINFKKPLLLKVFLLSLVGGILIYNLSNLLHWNIYIIIFSRFLMTISGLNFLYFLYRHTFSKKIFILALVVLAVIVVNAATKNLYLLGGMKIVQPIRYLNMFLVSAAVFYFYLIIYKRMIQSLSDNSIYSKKIKKWSKLAIVFFSIGIMNNMLTFYFAPYMMISKLVSASTHLALCIILQYRPAFLNRTKLSISLGEAFMKNSSNQIDEQSFTQQFYINQYYLNKEASIQDLALHLKVSSDILSTYIYESSKMTFTDFINKSRIDYFVTLASSKEYSSYSIEGLSELAGFGSRHSLYRNFKKFHGGHPNDLIKMYE